MKRIMKRALALLLVFLCLFGVLGTDAAAKSKKKNKAKSQTEAAQTEKAQADKSKESKDAEIDEDGTYYSKDEVALYIYTYDKLPKNFMTKKEAKKLGWEGGALDPYAPDMSIGGDVFGNYEGTLPEKKGRTYHECDIDTQGKKRGAKRIVFSDDGLIYYTEDHYETFELLYGEE